MSVRDYLKVSNVSKTWKNILKEDLKYNKQRLKEIRIEKRKALSTKVIFFNKNIVIQFSLFIYKKKQRKIM